MYDIITANMVKRPFCEYSVAAWKLSCGGGKMRPSHLSPKQIFDYACMDAETLYQKLGVSPAGLSQEEAEKSRAQHGKNSGPGRKSDTVLHRLRRAFVNPFAVILLVLASISLVTDGFDQGAHYSITWVLIRFMAVLIPVVFVACGLTQGNWFSAFLFALSVAVGLTPEMLPMVITACLAKGSGAMGKKQTVVKNINAMQEFGSMDILCVDKTGTLTGDRISLEYYMDILGNENQAVLDLAYINSCYHTGVQNHLDAALLKCREMPGKGDHFQQLSAQHPKLDELPFDYDRKFASVLVKGTEKNLLLVKGSVSEVCRRCRFAEYKGTQREMGQLQKIIPQNSSAFITECSTDLIAVPVSGIIVRFSKLSGGERNMLLDYYSEIGDFSEAVILIGEISLPPNLHRKINVFSSFELMQQQIKFIIMDTYRKQKKYKNFSIIVANTLFVLSAIKNSLLQKCV